MESVLALGHTLSDPDWSSPTECPKWTVKDVYAHLIGGEQWMAEGHPRPEDYEAWSAGPVQARRDTPPAAILDELRKVYEYRLVQLEREPIDPAAPAHLPTGEPITMAAALRTRVFDVWTHEQDIRRAVERPGNLASPAAALTGEILVGLLPRIVAKDAKAAPGATVRLTTTGEIDIDVAVIVDRSGKGRIVGPSRSAQTHLTMRWESYARLSAGRGSRADHDVRVTGDRALGERVLSHLSIAP
ncbi:MAG TPA: maleylpyruvate isomerase family mycothiol-dependent enzyme [Natronosporangium sp.]